jgi:hypothetical protein
MLMMPTSHVEVFPDFHKLTQVHPNAIHMLGIQCPTGIRYSWYVCEALQPVLVVLYYCFNLNLAKGAGFCT